MPIPILALKPTYLELREEMDAAYRRVMESGWYLLGAETEAFESEFAAYTGAKHCISVGNGLDAIRIALEAHGVGPGDEVLVPAHTFIATWLAVTQCGATPVGVDVAADTANLDPRMLERALTPRTKAVIPVHLYGQPADMGPINEFAAAHGLSVVEDSAQAHGARYLGKRCGNLGSSAAFSFYPGKNLGAFSDGGAITTNDDEVARKAKRFRNYGSEKRYYHDVPGINSRMDELQAAFLRVKLAKLDEWNARRLVLAERYRERLGSVEGLRLQAVPEWADPVWHLFTVRHAKRDALQQYLAEKGIQTIIHYPILPHRSGAYAASPCVAGGPFPAAEDWAATVLSLPMGPHTAMEEVDAVCDAIGDFQSAGGGL